MRIKKMPLPRSSPDGWTRSSFRIPGTKFKIGLDPLIAFIPGIGDFLSSSVSAVVILESVRKGVAFSVIFRMGLNMVINALFDAIPGIGPFFSAFFKSNSRNLMLLQRWQEGEQQAVKRSSRIVLLSVVVLFCLCLALALLVWSLHVGVDETHRHPARLKLDSFSSNL